MGRIASRLDYFTEHGGDLGDIKLRHAELMMIT
jgi:hypothetical protein